MAAHLALWLALGSALAATQAPSKPTTTRVVFHESAVVDLYYHVRLSESAAALEAFAPAARAARALDRSLGGQALAWGPLDGLLPGCKSAAEVRAAFERAPETLKLRGGTKVELRKAALELAEALVPAEAAFVPKWEERRAKLGAAREHWERAVGAREPELIARHLEALGMEDPRIELPVYLVTEAPWPGALTVLGAEGRGVSFVAPDAAEGSQFLETVLHEVTHSLDVAAGERSVFGELRRRLAGAGLDLDQRPGDPAHTLMFVQCAESIRRSIDREHVDYGERQQLYARIGASATLVRELWRDHLDGKSTREEALDELVAGLAPPAK